MLLCVCSHVTVQCNLALVGKLCMFLGGSPPPHFSPSFLPPLMKRDCGPASSSSAQSGSEPPSLSMLRLSRTHPPPPWPCCCWPQPEGLTQLRAGTGGVCHRGLAAAPPDLGSPENEAGGRWWILAVWGSCFWLSLCTGGVSIPAICSTYLVRTQRSQEAFPSFGKQTVLLHLTLVAKDVSYPLRHLNTTFAQTLFWKYQFQMCGGKAGFIFAIVHAVTPCCCNCILPSVEVILCS